MHLVQENLWDYFSQHPPPPPKYINYINSLVLFKNTKHQNWPICKTKFLVNSLHFVSVTEVYVDILTGVEEHEVFETGGFSAVQLKLL